MHISGHASVLGTGGQGLVLNFQKSSEELLYLKVARPASQHAEHTHTHTLTHAHSCTHRTRNNPHTHITSCVCIYIPRLFTCMDRHIVSHMYTDTGHNVVHLHNTPCTHVLTHTTLTHLPNVSTHFSQASLLAFALSLSQKLVWPFQAGSSAGEDPAAGPGQRGAQPGFRVRHTQNLRENH